MNKIEIERNFDTTITFTRESLEQLQEKYDQALLERKNSFQFEGHTLIVDYAKYLIEYLRAHFDRRDTQ